jgi:uncharacterized protein (TIGR01777 family)
MYNTIAICGPTSPFSKAFSKLLTRSGFKTKYLSTALLKQPPTDVAKEIDGCFAVCNVAGVPIVAKWNDHYVHDIYCSRWQSIRTITNAFLYCNDKPKVFINMSNAMIYDEYDVHDDYSTLYGDSFLSEVGVMETKEVLKIQKKLSDTRFIIARSGYFMNKNSGMYPLLKKINMLGLGGRIGDGHQCIPIVHIEDAAEAVFFLTTNVNCQGIYNIVSPEIASMNEIIKTFSRSFGLKLLTTPKPLIRLLVGDAISILEQNCKVMPTRLMSSGFKFKYNNAEEILSALR